MTARELDPAVWAAAYGTTYAMQAEAVRLAGAEGNAFGINVERCRQVADDAVLSLHPLGFDCREILDRMARATTHPEALRAPLPLPERAPETPAARLVPLGDVSPGAIVTFLDGSRGVRLAANLPRGRVDVASLKTGTIDEHDAATVVSLGAG